MVTSVTSFVDPRMPPEHSARALLDEPAHCPKCESHLRADGTCACGYGKPVAHPVAHSDLEAADSRYMARVRARMNEKALASSWWADRILERHARGEQIDILPLEWAKQCATKS